MPAYPGLFQRPDRQMANNRRRSSAAPGKRPTHFATDLQNQHHQAMPAPAGGTSGLSSSSALQQQQSSSVVIPGSNAGLTMDMTRPNGSNEATGSRRRSLLLFQNKVSGSDAKGQAGGGGGGGTGDEDPNALDPDGEMMLHDDDENNNTNSNNKDKDTAVPTDPANVTTSDLFFFLFDGFPSATITGYFPTWYNASLWAERLNTLFVLISIVAIATETLPEYYIDNDPAFFYVEIACITYFTLEFVVRLVCTRDFWGFWTKILNWVDLISILPFYIGLIMQGGDGVEASGGLVLLRFFRLLRILRVLKLSRRNVGLLAVFEALYESSEAIALLGFLVLIALMVFSTLMYFAEQLGARFDEVTGQWIRDNGTVSPFQSIFHTMWWCIVTMTTVGYGDDVPVTVVGKLVGGATMLAGVFVLAFPTVILSTNFQEIHQSKVEGQRQMERVFAAQREAARKRAEARRRREEEEEELAAAEEEEMAQQAAESAAEGLAEGADCAAVVVGSEDDEKQRRSPPPIVTLDPAPYMGDDDDNNPLEPRPPLEPTPPLSPVSAANRPRVFPFIFRPYQQPQLNLDGGEKSILSPSQPIPLAADNIHHHQPHGNNPLCSPVSSLLSPQHQQTNYQNSPPALGLGSGGAGAGNVVSMAFGTTEESMMFQSPPTRNLPTVAQERAGKVAIARDIVVVDDMVAVYNPVLHLQCNSNGELSVKVEHFLTRTVVTMQLLLESQECQEAAEEAMKKRRPDLVERNVPVLPRPISKLKVDVHCAHPLLSDVRLQSGAFVEPAGIVSLSLLVPYPSLVRVLLANLSTLTVVTWVAFDSPGALEEPLIHYGGVVLGETDFDDEELDEQSRQLLSETSAYPNNGNKDGTNSPGNPPNAEGSGIGGPKKSLFSSGFGSFAGAVFGAVQQQQQQQPQVVSPAMPNSSTSISHFPNVPQQSQQQQPRVTSAGIKRVRLLDLPCDPSASAANSVEVSDEDSGTNSPRHQPAHSSSTNAPPPPLMVPQSTVSPTSTASSGGAAAAAAMNAPLPLSGSLRRNSLGSSGSGNAPPVQQSWVAHAKTTSPHNALHQHMLLNNQSIPLEKSETATFNAEFSARE